MENELKKLRAEITNIDQQIFELFEKRFEIVRKIGEYKKENNLPVRNMERERELVEQKIENSKLDEKFIRELYDLIFNNSYKIEE